MEAVDIHKACRIGDAQGLIRVLSRSPDSVNTLDPKLGWPPLYRAVICNQFAIAKILLERGADPNQSNRLGEAPLHQAADGGLEEFSRLLLVWKADPNVQQRGDSYADGETPLHRAAEKGRVHVAELLLQSSASVNIRSKSVRLTSARKNAPAPRCRVQPDRNCSGAANARGEQRYPGLPRKERARYEPVTRYDCVL